VALAGARALCGPRSATPPFLSGPLPAVPSEPVELDQLVRFFAHPVRAFLRQRLGVSLGTSADELAEALPIELDPLEHWALGQRLLEARLAGADPRSSVAAEVARGALPPGALAGPILERVGRVVEDLVREAGALVPMSATSSPVDVHPVDIHLLLPGGRLLVGTVPDVADGMLRSVTFSRVGPRHRLGSWVRFLAVCAARPDERFEAVTLGRARPGRGRAFVTVARLTLPGDGLLEGTELGRQFALDRLIDLVDLYDRGMGQAPPLYCKTSAAYAEAAALGHDPRAAARLAWETTHNFANEDRDLEHQLVHGGILSIGDLLAPLPDSDEAGQGWNAEETSRVGRYSRRLWDPLLSVERVTDR
ncbi:MAG: exodeoxyribonuclease V subunit gamma, partial [Acidimicrobiia bacterium]